MWDQFKSGTTIGTIGSESGVVELDEEHQLGARITLESSTPTAPFAIVCGIYSWMFHTRYFPNDSEAKLAFDEMKADVGRILNLIDSIPDGDWENTKDAVVDAIREFIERFP